MDRTEKEPDPVAKPLDDQPSATADSSVDWSVWRPRVERSYDELLNKVTEKHSNVDRELMRSAFLFALEAYGNRRRLSGEPTITHSLAVAHILADLRLDPTSITAALLHDVVEDTPVTLDQVKARFGEEIAGIVDGVTKLGGEIRRAYHPEPMPAGTGDTSDSGGSQDPRFHRQLRRQRARQMENIRHLLNSALRDIRVLLVKLADRLHNMRTLDAKAPEDQVRIATETAQIYAPCAHLLGIWQLKWELEDLAFRYTDPEEYRRIASLVATTRANRQNEVDEAVAILKDHLIRSGLHRAEVTGRAKHLYSIYQKMRTQGIPFTSIYDLVALRIIVDTREQCYSAYGYLSELWPPIPNTFADYIARPKPNLYQSLHVKVEGPGKKPIEVQIRTRAMHEMAEYGLPAHWAYKQRGEGADARAEIDRRISAFRRHVAEFLAEPAEYDSYRAVVEPLVGDEILVYTPKGDPYELPRGATIVDFAYRIHSDIGDHAIGATVAGRFVPLSYECRHGDTISVVTRSNASPGRDWLTLAKTPHARSKIKAYFSRMTFEENLERGRTMLQEAAAKMGIDPPRIKEQELDAVAESFNRPGSRELLAAIGRGAVGVHTVLRKLVPDRFAAPRATVGRKSRPKEAEGHLTIDGLDNVKYRRSRCCYPLPGDVVGGFITVTGGLAVHRASCPEFQRFTRERPERVYSAIEYRPPTTQNYVVRMHVYAEDRRALLADVSAAISDLKINITHSRTHTYANGTALLEFDVYVRDAEEYERLAQRVLRVPDIISIHRPPLPPRRPQ